MIFERFILDHGYFYAYIGRPKSRPQLVVRLKFWVAPSDEHLLQAYRARLGERGTIRKPYRGFVALDLFSAADAQYFADLLKIAGDYNPDLRAHKRWPVAEAWIRCAKLLPRVSQPFQAQLPEIEAAVANLHELAKQHKPEKFPSTLDKLLPVR